MNVGSVFSINGARDFLHEVAVDPSVQALHAARDGPGFLLYEKKATYSPKGPRDRAASSVEIRQALAATSQTASSSPQS